MMDFVVENMVVQWVRRNTRTIGQNEPYSLDLVSIKAPNDKHEVKYQWVLESNHIVHN